MKLLFGFYIVLKYFLTYCRLDQGRNTFYKIKLLVSVKTTFQKYVADCCYYAYNGICSLLSKQGWDYSLRFAFFSGFIGVNVLRSEFDILLKFQELFGTIALS